MTKVAVVGLNSFYRSGASTFMAHLAHGSDWDIVLFSPSGEHRENDIPLSTPGLRAEHVRDLYSDILNDYDIVIFAAPRWAGGYEFLETVKVDKVGIIVHDRQDFERMGMYDLMGMFPKSEIFYMGRWKMPVGAMNIPLPFSTELVPDMSMDRDIVFCPARPTPSKHHDWLKGQIRRKFTTNGADVVFPEEGVVKSFGEMGEMYARSFAIVDVGDTASPYYGPFYTTLEAWHFGAVPIHDNNFDCTEVIPKVTCLEFSHESVELAIADDDLRGFIVDNGRFVLKYHEPDYVRKIIMEVLSL